MSGNLIKTTGATLIGKIAGTFFFGLFAAGALFIGSLPWVWPDPVPTRSAVVYILIGLIGAGACLYAVFSILRSKVEFWDDRIVAVRILQTTEMLKTHMVGYRTYQGRNSSTIQISGKAKVTSLFGDETEKTATLTVNPADFHAWHGEGLKDLDAQDKEEQWKAAMADESLGATQEERKAALARAGQAGKFLVFAGLGVGLWGFFFPQPNGLVIPLLMAVPFVAMGMVAFFRGALRFSSGRITVYPSAGAGLFLPVFALAANAFMDGFVLSWDNFWIPYAALAALVFGLVLFSSWALPKTASLLMTALVISMIYGYGSTLALNKLLDKSQPAVYQADVLDHRISRGSKSTSYYITLSPWGPETDTEEHSVGSKTYYRRPVGSKVDIYLSPGAFHIPHFYIY